jgi:hypothetical protein
MKMKNSLNNTQNLLVKNYKLINYFLVFSFIILNLTTDRINRNIISTIFIVLILPVLYCKLNNDLKYDEEHKTTLTKNTFFKMLIIFIILALLYFMI